MKKGYTFSLALPSLPSAAVGSDRQYLRETGTDNPTYIIVEEGGVVELFRTTVAGGVANSLIMTEIVSRIAPRSDRVSLAVEASLCAVCGIFREQLRSVVGVKVEFKVRMPDETARSILRFKRKASAISKAGAYYPASL